MPRSLLQEIVKIGGCVCQASHGSLGMRVRVTIAQIEHAYGELGLGKIQLSKGMAYGQAGGSIHTRGAHIKNSIF